MTGGLAAFMSVKLKEQANQLKSGTHAFYLAARESSAGDPGGGGTDAPPMLIHRGVLRNSEKKSKKLSTGHRPDLLALQSVVAALIQIRSLSLLECIECPPRRLHVPWAAA